MNIPRPDNSITRARQNAQTSAIEALPPEVPINLIDRLEALFPPTCYDPSVMNEWKHHRYAGMVELTALLRTWHEASRTQGIEIAGETEAGPDLSSAEAAR